MFKKQNLLQPLAFAALLAVSAASNAAFTPYTSSASFASAVTAPGVDTYAGFSITGSTPSPITRSAGAYSYRAAASTSSFFGAGTTANPWLATNIATDSITFSNFSGGASAIGGNFFGSDVNGLFLAGSVTLTALDSFGATLTQTITGATVSSFMGFVSTGTLVSLTVASVQPTTGFLWPTVDNLTIAVSAVPEPSTYALMFAGLGVIGAMARRRRV